VIAVKRAIAVKRVLRHIAIAAYDSLW